MIDKEKAGFKKYEEPITHYRWSESFKQFVPARFISIPEIKFKHKPPLRDIFLILSSPYLGLVDKQTVENSECIYQIISNPAKTMFYYTSDDNWINYFNFRKRKINWLGTVREFDYFFKLFKQSFFPDSKVSSGTFFEFYCLKKGKFYPRRKFYDVLKHDRFKKLNEDKIKAINTLFNKFSPKN